MSSPADIDKVQHDIVRWLRKHGPASCEQVRRAMERTSSTAWMAVSLQPFWAEDLLYELYQEGILTRNLEGAVGHWHYAARPCTGTACHAPTHQKRNPS